MRVTRERRRPWMAPPSHRLNAFAPGRVVRLVAADRCHVHQFVYAALARDGVRRFLFWPLASTEGVHAVLVRPFDVATRFAEGREFRMLLRRIGAARLHQ